MERKCLEGNHTQEEKILLGHDLDGNPLEGEQPSGPVPVMVAHNGIVPGNLQEYVQISKALNNGHPPEVVSKRPGIIRILVRYGTGWKEGPAWKILVGSGAAIGTAVGIFEVTKKILEAHKKTQK